MIKLNHQRLDKALKAFHANTGQIEYHQDQVDCFADEDSPILKRLMLDLNDASIPNHEVAVLVRYNVTRSFISDYLARHGMYVNVATKSMILQNQHLYAGYVDVMRGLWDDQFILIKLHASKLGFSRYKHHLEAVLRATHVKVTHLSDYLALAKAYNDVHGSTVDDRDVAIDEQLSQLRKACEDTKFDLNFYVEATPPLNIAQLLGKVSALEQVYYDYMTDRNFISQRALDQFLNYLTGLTNGADPLTFFALEDVKRKKLESLVGKSDTADTISILSCTNPRD